MYLNLEPTFAYIRQYVLGLIQNAEDKLVKLVEELVVSHIRGNSLILVALPMTGELWSLLPKVLSSLINGSCFFYRRYRQSEGSRFGSGGGPSGQTYHWYVFPIRPHPGNLEDLIELILQAF